MLSKIPVMRTVVYTPESPLKHPLQFFRGMLYDLRISRTLAWRLIVRDISAQYRQTALGYLWAVLPIVVTSTLWVFLNYSQIVVVESEGVPYPVYALTGMTFWQLFVEAFNSPLAQVNANRSMLSKVNFPKEALILSGMAQVLFSFLIKLLILAVMLLLFQVSVHWTTVLLILPISGLLMIGTLVGVLLVPIGILYRDIQQGIGVIINPLMFITPVVYPAPESGLLALVMRYNPLTPLFEVIRDLLYVGISDVLGWSVIVLATAFLLTILGWAIYRLALPILIERLDA